MSDLPADTLTTTIANVLAELNAEGWETGSEHDPGCPGDEAYCMSHCPVPVQVRISPDDIAAAVVSVLATHNEQAVEKVAAIEDAK